MKAVLALSMMLLTVCVCPASFGDDLKRLSLDDAGSIGLAIQNDQNTKVEGQGSIKITTAWSTSVCLGEIGTPDFDYAKLIFKAKVKSELDGIAYLEMWAHLSGRRYFSRGLKNPIKGKADWRTLETPFYFQIGQKPDKITLNLVVSGQGTVWVDDVVLATERFN